MAGEVPLPDASGVTADVVGVGHVADALKSLQNGVDKEIQKVEPPYGLKATLRPYQGRGLGWLRSVTDTGFGACLADDMGLGKTVQMLAMFQALTEETDGLRFLVVCPTSVIGN